MVIERSLLVLLAILNFYLLETAESQSPITFHAHLSVENYLKDRQINKIDRDNSGIFWLLESSVIQKYDGRYVTEKIPHDVVNPKYFKCLSDNTILLVSNESTIFLIDKENKSVKPLIPKIASCDNCQLFDVNLIEEKLYLYYRHENSYMVYSSSDRIEFVKEDEVTVSNPDKVINFFKVGDGYLLLTDDERAIHIRENSETELSLPAKFREVNAAVISDYMSADEIYFSLPRRNGTYVFKNGNLTTISETEKLVFAKKDRKGKILLALSRSFLHSEDVRIVDKDSIYSWPELTAINETYIDAYVEDVNDKILLGSHTGVFFVDLKNKGIQAYHQSKLMNNGFGNVIMSFAELANGEIFYVKENKGIFKFNRVNEPEELPVSDQLLNNLNCVFDPSDDQLWISGYTNERAGVLYSYDYKTEQVERFDFDKPVMYFKRSGKDELILSSSTTLSSSILRYNTKLRKTIDTIASLNNERSRKFEFHSEKELLIGTNKRLLLYNMDDKTIKSILPKTRVQTLIKTINGYGICTIGKGIIFLDKQLNVVKEVNESNGLTSNQIYSLTEDKNGRFWAGTGKGINVLDKDYKYIRSIREYDGLSSYELNTNAAIVLRNGNMLFGSINGLTEIDPELALASSESSVLNIPELSYSKDGERVIRKITEHSLNIPADARDLVFNLEQNDFYKYSNIDNPIAPKLQVFPEDLDYQLGENKILISKLKKEQSKLNIFPSNPLKSSEKISLVLNKKNNYSTLFLVLGILMLVGIGTYLGTSAILRFNKNREKERRENEVRMAELELQALRSQMNPHFIFNSLGAILLYLQTNENKKAEKYLTKFAKLMRMFLESSKSKFVSFAVETELLELYLELEKLRFEDKFTFDFQIDKRIDQNALTLPSMLLQPFVENSVNHGLYHKKTNDGLLSIKAIPVGESVKVFIRDNGVGREKSTEIRAKSLKKHRSRATEIIQERLQVLKTEKDIDIDISYNDLRSADGLGIGTEVVITIPKILKTYD